MCTIWMIYTIPYTITSRTAHNERSGEHDADNIVQYNTTVGTDEEQRGAAENDDCNKKVEVRRQIRRRYFSTIEISWSLPFWLYPVSPLV